MRSCLACCIRPPPRRRYLRSFPPTFPRIVQDSCFCLVQDRSTFDTSAVGRPGAAAVASSASEDRLGAPPAALPPPPLPAQSPQETFAAAARAPHVKSQAKFPAEHSGHTPCSRLSHSESPPLRRDHPSPL